MNDKLMRNPFGLTDHEMPMYNAFVSAMGRKPESMWDLMQGSAIIQDANKRDREFWREVLGL